MDISNILKFIIKKKTFLNLILFCFFTINLKIIFYFTSDFIKNEQF